MNSRASGYYSVLETLSDLEVIVETEINDPVISVSILDTITGVHAKGSAKRVPDDDFSLNTGRNLAVARALTRFGQRLEKVVLAQTEHA